MRRLVATGVAVGLCLVAVIAGRATSAHAFIPPPGPDPGVAAGGYMLVGPDVETARVRFEVAVRQSQLGGVVYGKSLTIRAFGALTCAIDTFCGTRYVARSWAALPLFVPFYPGIPPAFGGGPAAPISTCSLFVFGSPGGGGFSGMANLFLVDPGGGEHFTGMTFPYIVDAVSGPDASPAGDFFTVSAPPLPMPLPGGPIFKGNVGTTDGVAPTGCP